MGDGTGKVVASGALSALAEEVAQGRLRLNAGVSRAASNASRVGCEEDTKAGATNERCGVNCGWMNECMTAVMRSWGWVANQIAVSWLALCFPHFYSS